MIHAYKERYNCLKLMSSTKQLNNNNNNKISLSFISLFIKNRNLIKRETCPVEKRNGW